jgi:hypothetical protein
MSGNHRHDSPDPDAAASGFLARWSERKRARLRHEADVPSAAPQPPAAAGEAGASSDGGSSKPVLTDRDMPSLDTLDGESDYSGFLSPGVSRELQRLALRKLFSAAKFQVRDGLDDYDTDYNQLQPLRRVLAGVQHEVRQPPARATGRSGTADPAAASRTPAAPARPDADADPVPRDDAPQPPAGRTEETG